MGSWMDFKHFLYESPRTYRIVRTMLAGVFVWSGIAKVVNPRAFARVLSGWDLVPDPLLAPVAIGLPVLELLAGLGLAFNLRGSLNTIAGLLLLFLAVLGYGISNNMNVDCGCFSPEELHSQNSLKMAFLRDVGLAGAAVYLFSWRWVHRRALTAQATGLP